MKINLKADKDLIERARSIARAQGTTLDAAFREWLVQFTTSEGEAPSYLVMMRGMSHVD
jgi:hypothetical protein